MDCFVANAPRNDEWNGMRFSGGQLESVLKLRVITPRFGIYRAIDEDNVPAAPKRQDVPMSLETIDLDAPPQSHPATPAVSPLLRRIDLTTLRLFIAVCEEQNLTRAANREGIAASAVSKRMNDFELAFGVTLFKAGV